MQVFIASLIAAIFLSLVVACVVSWAVRLYRLEELEGEGMEEAKRSRDRFEPRETRSEDEKP
jgi:hypothetical protein